MKYILGYFVFLNLVSFVVFALDKYKAIHHHWRIKEKTFLGLTLLGGGFGILLGMQLFHHKTRKGSFLSKYRAISFVRILGILGALVYCEF